MYFRFSPEQRSIQAAAQDLLSRECSATALRAEWTTGRRPAQRWQRLAELGAPGLLIPRQWGGAGLNEVDVVLLLEESGRFALPDPLVETALVAAPLLHDTAPPRVRDVWLPKIAAGTAKIAVGLQPAGRLVSDVEDADLILLQEGDALHALSPADVRASRQPSVDGTHRVFSVEWSPHAATVIADGPGAAQAIQRAFDRGAFGAAAQLLGLSDQMISMAVRYARDREQFGRPIGAFQAIKHQLANALLALEFARPLVYSASWSLARKAEDSSRAVSMAKAAASDAAVVAGHVALQVHGAIGYTWEHDLHLWMKRAWVLSNAWGGASWHQDRVADSLFGCDPRHDVGERAS